MVLVSSSRLEGYGRDLGIGDVRLDQIHLFFRMEVELYDQLSGEQVLQLELGLQSLPDELHEESLRVVLTLPAGYAVRIDLGQHRYLDHLGVRIERRLMSVTVPTFTPLNTTGAPDVEPLDRPSEIHDKGGLPGEISSGAEGHDPENDQDNRPQDKGTDGMFYSVS